MSSLLETEVVRGSRSVPLKGRIRLLTENDLGLIDARTKRMFFELPWRDPSLCSLAYEDHSGSVIACLGVMPRPMKFRGRPIRAAVAHHLVMEPSRRGTRAAVELARQFINGPQDLSIASGNDFSRRIWRIVGGIVSPLHSFSWTHTLRPAQYALTLREHRGMSAPAALTLRPACRAIDATVNLFSHVHLPATSDSMLSDDLDAVTMLACLSAFAGERAVQPHYDVASLEWLMDTLAASGDRGRLHKVAVRTQSGRALGWYLYYLRSSGIVEVLQVGGPAETIRAILHHLFEHARQRGAVAVTGQIDARLCGVLSENRCVFHRPDNGWILFHAREQRLADAFHGGDVFLSRLEGDWWTAS